MWFWVGHARSWEACPLSFVGAPPAVPPAGAQPRGYGSGASLLTHRTARDQVARA
jgi:hypothetical protein